jgi:cobalt-zinc-cadmium efflux system outer membrane protein
MKNDQKTFGRGPGKVFILLLLPVLLIQAQFSPAAAQAKDSMQEHSLGAYIRRALDGNPELVARRHMVAADKEKIAAAIALPDPIAGVSFTRGPSGIEAEKFSLSQGIPWPGRLISNRKSAQASYLASREMEKNLETGVLYRVRTAYGKMYAMVKMAGLEQESLQLLKRAESGALAGYATSMQSQASVLKLQLEMAVAEDQIRQFEVEANIARDELAGLLDISPSGIPDPDSLPQLAVPFTVAEAQKIAMELNPEVRAAGLEAIAARYNVSSARTMFVPDLMLGADYVPQGSSLAMSGGQRGWMFMAGLSLPLWPWSKAAEVRMARKMEAYKNASVEAQKNGLAAEASMYFREYYDAVRRIRLLDTVLIPKAKQTLTTVEEAYRTSRATLMDYIDSERMLLDLKMQRVTQEERREKMAGRIVICCLAKY